LQAHASAAAAFLGTVDSEDSELEDAAAPNHAVAKPRAIGSL
jgi:hypothetical protein